MHWELVKQGQDRMLIRLSLVHHWGYQPRQVRYQQLCAAVIHCQVSI